MTLEEQFHKDMESIYFTSKREIGYNPTRFIQLVAQKHGVPAAKQLIAKSGGTYGFEILWEKHRLDLSVENLVLQEKYSSLFTEEEKQICRKRLQEFGYNLN